MGVSGRWVRQVARVSKLEGLRKQEVVAGLRGDN